VTEGAFLQPHVGVEVDLRRLYRFVAKPERNHRKVDSSPQEIHRGGVAQRMRRDQSAYERGAVRAGRGDMTGNERLEGVGAQEASA